jgi:hypothetical protein
MTATGGLRLGAEGCAVGACGGGPALGAAGGACSGLVSVMSLIRPSGSYFDFDWGKTFAKIILADKLFLGKSFSPHPPETEFDHA